MIISYSLWGFYSYFLLEKSWAPKIQIFLGTKKSFRKTVDLVKNSLLVCSHWSPHQHPDFINPDIQDKRTLEVHKQIFLVLLFQSHYISVIITPHNWTIVDSGIEYAVNFAKGNNRIFLNQSKLKKNKVGKEILVARPSVSFDFKSLPEALSKKFELFFKKTQSAL